MLVKRIEMTNSQVYELIEILKEAVETEPSPDTQILLLSALGELGYTVPGFVPDNLFKCGLCHANGVRRIKFGDSHNMGSLNKGSTDG